MNDPRFLEPHLYCKSGDLVLDLVLTLTGSVIKQIYVLQFCRYLQVLLKNYRVLAVFFPFTSQSVDTTIMRILSFFLVLFFFLVLQRGPLYFQKLETIESSLSSFLFWNSVLNNKRWYIINPIKDWILIFVATERATLPREAAEMFLGKIICLFLSFPL